MGGLGPAVEAGGKTESERKKVRRKTEYWKMIYAYRSVLKTARFEWDDGIV